MIKIINALKAISGTNAKIEYIQNLTLDERSLLLELLLAAMTPNVTYNFNDLNLPAQFHCGESLSWALKEIKVFTTHIDGPRDAAVQAILTRLSQPDAEVLKMVLCGKLTIGLKNKNLRKIWSDFPQPHPYNKCTSFTQFQKNFGNSSTCYFPLFSQTKEDGLYVDIIAGVCYTRAGNKIDVLPEKLKAVFETFGNFVFQGEILARNTNGEILSRQESNGMNNRIDNDKENNLLVLFDMVKLEEWKDLDSNFSYESYFSRFSRLNSTVKSNQFNDVRYWVKIVDTKIVDNTQQLENHFKENLQKGLEGVIVKDFAMLWKNGVNPQMAKLKVECTADLKIVGWYCGDSGTKFADKIGGFNVESECGKVKFNVGSGLTDKIRESVGDSFIGKIIEVKFNDILLNTSQDEEFYTFYLPRFVSFRDDKTEADNYESIKNAFDSVANLIITTA